MLLAGCETNFLLLLIHALKRGRYFSKREYKTRGEDIQFLPKVRRLQSVIAPSWRGYFEDITTIENAGIEIICTLAYTL